ncbi:MAG: GNAT family N-acetyltransferase [Tissierellia bacterium]|nr:GNAT family N-acetyltransferase [Tissierellia bacterium]
MKIRLGRKNDERKILELYTQGKNWFRKFGIDQWLDGYPNEESFLEDIKEKHLYLWEDDEVMATGVLMTKQEPTYKNIYKGKWHFPEPYGTIHRFTVANKWKGQGLGLQCFKDLEEIGKEKGCKSIRIDTHEDNKCMKRLIEKAGYMYAGIIYLEDGAKRLAYEKSLEE